MYKQTKNIARIIVCLSNYERMLRICKDNKAHYAYCVLNKYMMEVNLQDLCILESIMWMGREKNYYPFYVRNPEKYFKDCFKDAYSTATESNKKQIVEYMTGKVDLSTFLIDGFSLLGIRLEECDD